MTYDVETKDGIVVANIPDDIPPDHPTVKAKVLQARQQQSATQKKPESLGTTLLGGALEPNAALLSGAIAQPLSGLAGIAGSLLPGPAGQGADWTRNVQHALTYAPRTEGGKQLPAALSSGMTALGNWASGSQGNTLASRVLGEPMAATLAEQGVLNAPALLSAKLGPVPAKMRSPTQISAGRILNKAAGEDTAAIVGALRNTKPNIQGEPLTAGEAAASVGRPEFNAVQEIVTKEHNPAAIDRITKAQNAARVAELRKVGQDKNALQAAKALREENAAQNYGAINNNLIDPRSETKIMQDAIAERAASKAEALRDAGRFSTTAAQQEVLGHGGTVPPTAGGTGLPSPQAVPVPGFPRVPARVTEHPERIAEANAAASDAVTLAKQRLGEEKFLSNTLDLLKQTVGMDDTALSSFLSRPSVRNALKEAADSAAETRSYFPTKPGDKFSVANLQRVKQALADAVAEPEQSGLKGSQRAEVTNTLNSFVKWFSSRSPEWKAARLQYAEDSRPINQMQVGQYLQDKLQPALADHGLNASQRAATYAQALRDAPGTIKRATGQPRYDELGQVLSPEQEASANAVGQSLGRSAEHERLAREGNTRARGLVEPPNLSSFGFFSPFVSFARGAVNRGLGIHEAKVNKLLADALRDPGRTADLMQGITRPRSAADEALMRALIFSGTNAQPQEQRK